MRFAPKQLDTSKHIVMEGGLIKLSQGSETSPSICFADDDTSGLYRKTNGEVGLSVDGSKSLFVNSDKILTIPGNDGIIIPSGTTANRPTSTSSGLTRFNSDLNRLELYKSDWKSLLDKDDEVLLQKIVNYVTPTISTGMIPFDSSVPLHTEGTEIWSHTFTPKESTSKVIVEYSFTMACKDSTEMVFALFRGNTCVGTTVHWASWYYYSGDMMTVSAQFLDYPGSTSAATYSLRAGTNISTTWYVNSYENLELGNTMAKSCYSIEEIK